MPASSTHPLSLTGAWLPRRPRLPTGAASLLRAAPRSEPQPHAISAHDTTIEAERLRRGIIVSPLLSRDTSIHAPPERASRRPAALATGVRAILYRRVSWPVA